MGAVLRIDLAVCAHSGLCRSMSPELFGVSRSGEPEVRQSRLRDDELIRQARDVAECCPTGAISLGTAPLHAFEEETTMAGKAAPADTERSGESIITEMWERNYDPPTRGILDSLPIKATWNCLDLGAGAGSMAYWMAGRASEGTVLAVDLDISELDPGRAPNLTVRQADVASVDLPEGGFDLILARAVLSALDDPDEALAKAVRWLAPGGWLVVEDFYFMPSEDSPTSYGRAVVDAYVATFQSHGVDARWARRIPARLAQAGLRAVGSQVRTLGPGQGTEENELMRARLRYQGAPLVENNLVSQADFDQFMSSLDLPEAQDVTTLQFSGWGQRTGA